MDVKRHLDDPAMDRIDHALGRPLDPLRQGPRNSFVVEPGCDEAELMAASLHWQDLGTRFGMQSFAVT